jgi:hypothetical protein
MGVEEERIKSYFEIYFDGYYRLDLFDLMKMLFDWKAETERRGGDIRKSIEIGKERFGLSEQLCDILRNTVDRMGW